MDKNAASESTSFGMMITMHKYAGLTCLLCVQPFQKLAEGLPYSKHIHSALICPITLEVMNEDNPPMVAPNGAVYSEAAVCKIAAQNNGMFKNPESGMISDPVCHGKMSVQSCKQTFLLQGICAKWMR